MLYNVLYGENDADQLAATMEVVGLPPVYMIERTNKRNRDLFYEAVHYVTKAGFQRYPYRKSLEKVLKTDDTDFLNFLNGTLE